MDKISRYKPGPGFPIPNNPNRKTQAKMLISMTLFIPNLLKKNGIVKIKSVSDICEIEIRIFGWLTPKESGYAVRKSCKKVVPKVFVICNAAPSSIAKRKKMNIFLFLNNTKASRPK